MSGKGGLRKNEIKENIKGKRKEIEDRHGGENKHGTKKKIIKEEEGDNQQAKEEEKR